MLVNIKEFISTKIAVVLQITRNPELKVSECPQMFKVHTHGFHSWSLSKLKTVILTHQELQPKLNHEIS